jgi:excinuclease ABC subunit A
MPQHDRIIIKGARQNNLKNIDIEIPRDKLVVITGLSGSGKSSLAFDTLYAEGQRRYVESLSAYARQFLGQMDKPDVDYIEGLSPAVSIDQKSTSRNPRSTVGTVTEIYDYLRLMYARIGKPHCPQCGREVAAQAVEQMVDRVMELPEGTRIQLLAPVVKGRKGEYKKEIEDIRKEGFSRVRIDGQILDLNEDETPTLARYEQHWIEIVIDRLIIKPEDSVTKRLADSMETALRHGEGNLIVNLVEQAGPESDLLFSEHFSCSHCGISMEEVAPRSFSFNSPYGACPECHGLGTKTEFDPSLIVPDRRKTINQGAIKPMVQKSTGTMHDWWKAVLLGVGQKLGFDNDTPLNQIDDKQWHDLMFGVQGNVSAQFRNKWGRVRNFDTEFAGIVNHLDRRLKETTSDYIRDDMAQYQSERPCPVCHGKRLKPEALAVTVGGIDISTLTAQSIGEAVEWFSTLRLTEREQTIGRQIVKEISTRLGFLNNVGLDYLALDRGAATLAGGEAQRIRLATQIGSGLMGVLYILDEPSIGLHQRDNTRLIETLVYLRDIGNSIIVVEHDEETMEAADHIVDIGPGAGEHGGEVVAQGTIDQIKATPGSITGQFLSGKRKIEVPPIRRPLPAPPAPNNGGASATPLGVGKRGGKNGKSNPQPESDSRWLTIKGARGHNLKDVTVSIPLGCFVAVTGVSGSGKSTLIQETLFPRLMNYIYGSIGVWAPHEDIIGVEHIDKVIDIDQSPIGRTPRSNPATYTGTFDLIRDLFSQTQDARVRGYQQGRFSFNVKGGRCESCKGDGIIKIEMHFLPDVYVPCEVCKGKRYNRETLEVKYKGKNISEVLGMTVSEACEFFKNVPRIARKLDTIHEVGLDYIRMGQPATTLSGGEAQRIKLAAELSKRSTGRTLYILDEPTTGLHFADVEKLLGVLGRLVDTGNTVLVIEHNLDVIKTADYLIDMGPEGGNAGGGIVVTGTPEEVAACPDSHTGRFLKKVLEGAPLYDKPQPSHAMVAESKPKRGKKAEKVGV